MRKIFVLMALSLAVIQRVGAQTFDFSAGLPPGWITIAQKVAPIDEGGRKGIELSGRGATLRAAPLVDLSSIKFIIGSPQANDDYTLVLESSRDTVTWRPLTKVERKAPPTAAAPTLYSYTVLSPGALYIQWRLSRYAGGRAVLYEVNATPMSPEERASVQRNKESYDLSKKINEAVTSQLVVAKFNSAHEVFATAALQYKGQLKILTQLRRAAAGVATLLETANAVDTRAEMANPNSYELFRGLVTDLKAVLPVVKAERLEALSNRMTELFQPAPTASRTRRMVSGVANVAVAVGSVVTGVNIVGVIENFKTLLADGYSPVSLRDKFPPEGKSKKDRPLRYLEAAEKGLTIYRNAEKFLDAIIADNERVGRLRVELAGVTASAEALNADTEASVSEYLVAIGVQRTDIDDLLRTGARTNAKLEAQIDGYIMNALGPADKWTGITPEKAEQLRELESRMRSVDELEKRYHILTSEVKDYYDSFAADLQQASPFEDQASKQTWEKGKARALEFITAAKVDFEKSITNVPDHSP